MRKSLVSVAVVGAIGMVSVPCAMGATEETWRLDDGFTALGGCGQNPGNSGASGRTCLPGSPANVKATAWSFSGTNLSATLASASVFAYSGGAGVTASGESGAPNHSIDNYQRVDGLLLSFWDKVTLTRITTGWVGPGSNESPSQSRDSDFSVLAYTGSGDPSASMSGKTAAQLLAAGWALVNHYDGTQSSSGETKSVNNEGMGGTPVQADRKYWLVTAYDPHFGAGTPSGTVDKGSGQYDFLKLYSVSFTQRNRTSEPGSLGLVALAVAGLWSMRRRTTR